MTDVEVARAELVRESRVYSRRRDVNPYVALLDEVKWRAGHVAAIRAKLAYMHEGELFVTDHNGNLVDAALVRRYDKERTLLDRACKLAIDAGVAERYVQLAELQGGAMFRILEQAFSDPLVALTDDQRNQLGPALERAFQAFQLQQETLSA